MNRLVQIQSGFQDYLRDSSKGADFKSQIIDDKKVGAEKRLGIYYDAYRLRIIEALAYAYPKLKALLGDDLFDKTARSYIDQYPSMYRNMRWVGDKMAEHLTNTLPQHPVAAEMAVFEWALGLAFDAEDMPVLRLDNLTQIPAGLWSDLQFAFHASVQLLPIKWNIIAIWKALDIEKNPPKPTQISQQDILVWRSDLDSHFRVVAHDESVAIQKVITGATFAAICEAIQNSMSEEAATLAAQLLSVWLRDGLISSVQTQRTIYSAN